MRLGHMVARNPLPSAFNGGVLAALIVWIATQIAAFDRPTGGRMTLHSLALGAPRQCLLQSSIRAAFDRPTGGSWLPQPQATFVIQRAWIDALLALTDAHTPFSLFLVRFLTELPSEGGVLDVISIYVMGALRDS